MEAYKIKANEEFCDHMLRIIKNGGYWQWKNDKKATYIVRDGKFYGDSVALSMVQQIVSPEYFKKNFEILK